MSVFSTNQARHLYVITNFDTSSNAAGALNGISKDAEGNVFLKLKNAVGESIRTDLLTYILDAKVTKARALARPLNAVSITANANPVVGEIYSLVLTYRNWLGSSDELLYHEHSSVKATSTNKSDLYKALALNLAKNTAKQELVSVNLMVNGAATLVKADTKAETLTGTYTSLEIVEKEQKWNIGVLPQVPVLINKDAVKCTWGTVVNKQLTDANALIKNGKAVADLEYFCLGERGDMYRNVGFPYVTPTKGLVNPANEYDIIDIHYKYVGANECAQASEKTLTLAVLNDGTGKYSDTSLVNKVIKGINDTGAVTLTALT